jgi:hypothetical protein
LSIWETFFLCQEVLQIFLKGGPAPDGVGRGEA